MVFFTCNGCNESLKKNQCEKHISVCRRSQSLSCVDCGKDFWGKDYQAHIKCISEEEKYSGKDYKPKANANKGEKKQEHWISQVQEAIGKASTSPQLRSVLERLLTYTNIPRKKAKFENFIRNSMKLHNESLIAQMWMVLEENKASAKAEPVASTSVQTSGPGIGNGQAAALCDSQGDGVTASKLSKREKKEARKLQQHRHEKKDKTGSEANEDSEAGSRQATSKGGDAAPSNTHDSSPDRKKKKRKRQPQTDDGAHSNVTSAEGLNDRKKRQHQEQSEDDDDLPENKKRKGTSFAGGFEVCPLNEPLQDISSENGGKKYSLPDVCLAVVRKYGEISMKKLKKKVAADYLASSANNKYHSEEKLWAAIEKKVKSNPALVLHKDNVKLRCHD